MDISGSRIVKRLQNDALAKATVTSWSAGYFSRPPQSWTMKLTVDQLSTALRSELVKEFSLDQ